MPSSAVEIEPALCLGGRPRVPVAEGAGDRPVLTINEIATAEKINPSYVSSAEADPVGAGDGGGGPGGEGKCGTDAGGGDGAISGRVVKANSLLLLSIAMIILHETPNGCRSYSAAAEICSRTSMREAEFRAWMEAEGYSKATVSTQANDVRRLNTAYGNLDDLPEGQSLESIRVSLAYTKADQRANRPSPAKFEIKGDLYANLSHYRTALNFYQRFLAARAAHHGGSTLGLSVQDILDAIARHDRSTPTPALPAGGQGQAPAMPFWLLHLGKRYPCQEIVHDTLAHAGNEARPAAAACKATLEALGLVVIDWPAFEAVRDTFLMTMSGFQDFRRQDGPYWKSERQYKNQAIDTVRTLAASGDDDLTVGEKIYRALSEGQGLPLSWRTLHEVRKSDAIMRDRFYETVARLARSDDDPLSTIADGARALERLKADGVAGLRRGEVLGIAISVVGTLNPEAATWFQVSRIEKMGERLFGRRLFNHTQFELSDLEEFLQILRALFAMLATELRWDPVDLFDVQGFVWVGLEDSKEVEQGAPPTDERPTAESSPVNEQEDELVKEGPYWFVGAAFGRTSDQLNRFLAAGVWEIDQPTDRHREQVRRMQPGQLIAIKATYVRKNKGDLPFDNRGRPVSVMAIKAIGRIIANPGDGARVTVDWQPRLEPPREWYHYTYQPTIWEVYPTNEMARRLILFAFHGDTQDHAWFQQNLPRWADLPADEGPAPDPVRRSPLNLILYGPPGTGKTYRTTVEAVRVCRGLDEHDPLLADPAQRHELRKIYEELRGQGQIGFVSFHQNYAYEDFVEGLRPKPLPGGAGFTLEPEPGILRQMAEAAEKSPEEHVLIIDEINRANISKVFGELITLIEPDKRLGMDEGLRLTLPYSKARFGLPPNLHIIGTMNTADRSIALLDTALRRRFEFRELMPNTALLEPVDGIDLTALLTTLNERIEYLFDREHQIGHAYFMRCSSRGDVDDVMRHKVIPLLAEYFYEDWAKVALVLGDGGDEGHEGDREGSFIDRRRLRAPARPLGEPDGDGAPRYRWTVRASFSYDGFTRS